MQPVRNRKGVFNCRQLIKEDILAIKRLALIKDSRHEERLDLQVRFRFNNYVESEINCLAALELEAMCKALRGQEKLTASVGMNPPETSSNSIKGLPD